MKGILTDEKFSREKYLKEVLTGNELIDEIIYEIQWAKEIDGKRVYCKKNKEYKYIYYIPCLKGFRYKKEIIIKPNWLI